MGFFTLSKGKTFASTKIGGNTRVSAWKNKGGSWGVKAGGKKGKSRKPKAAKPLFPFSPW